MRLPRVLRTTTFRLAAIYVAGFAVAVAILGLTMYWLTAGVLQERLDTRIGADMHELEAGYRSGGLPALIDAVRQREARSADGMMAYAVLAQGRRIAGHLTLSRKAPGWSTVPYADDSGEAATRRVLVADFAGGVVAAVAADQEQVEDVKDAIFDGFLSAFGAVLVLGIAGGLGLSLALLRRVEAIRQTAQAIIAGDLTQRIGVHGSGDDFDRLSQTLNQMLDRIGELMASLREVSANIAHDLKTPLARLRQGLEAAQARPGGPDRQTLEDAVARIDDILATFSALLRIAQIEAGTRRAGFAQVDLSEIFNTIADAFAPAAEDAGKTLTASVTPGIIVTGDRDLLTQMLANMLDNAIRHTGPATRISLVLRRDGDAAIGSVADSGPGVPAAERDRIFVRFHRLAQSQDVPGSGLGLSLVKAVADLHGIALTADDAAPGLRLTLRFPSVGPCTPAAPPARRPSPT